MGGKLIKIGFIVSALFFSFNVFGYDNLNTHPVLTEAAISSFNANSSQKITTQQSSWIIQGSINEDTDPRYLNHFYDPTTGLGLNNWDSVGGAPIFAKGLSAKEWAQNQASLTGDYSEAAILKNYQAGDSARAYQGIGHIIHLIQDMAVPAHTRNDPHSQGDPYEKWAEQYNLVNKNSLVFLSVNTLNQAFEQLASYSNNNFFSKDTINIKNQSNYNKLYEQVDGKTRMYLQGQINNLSYRLVYSKNPDSVNPVFQVDSDLKLNQDYWNMLYPKAVGYSAGVIDYFIKQLNQIDQNKKAEEQSLADKFKKFLVYLGDKAKYAWGDVFMANRIALTDGLDKTLALLDISKSNLQNFSDANKEIITQVAEQTADTAKKTAGKVLSAKETKQTKTSASKQPVNASEPTKTIENKKPEAKTQVPQIKGEKIYSESAEPVNEEIKIPLTLPRGYSGHAFDKGGAVSGPIFIAGDSLPPKTEIISSPPKNTNLTSADFAYNSNEANSSYECQLDNAEWQVCGSSASLSDLSDGDHVFKVRAIDVSGNVDVNPPEYAWTIDTANPVVSIISGPLDFASSTQADFGLSSDIDVSFQCKLDGGDWQTCAEANNFTGLAEGRHVFDVRGSDLAGNTGSTTTREWIIDLTAPVSAVAALDASYAATGFTVNWNGEDYDAAGATATSSGVKNYDVQYKIGAGDWQNWAEATTSTSTIFSVAVSGGETVSFRSHALDLAGNAGEWSAETQTKIDDHAANHIVISEFSAHGPVGATDEFVELYNPTGQSVDLTGWKLQSKPAVGGSWVNRTGDSGLPSGSIAAKGFYLITASGYSLAAAPDYRHGANWGLADDGGHVKILDSNNIEIDKVGYGGADSPEGTAFAVSFSAGQSLERKAFATSTAETMAAGGAHEKSGNSYDSDNNSADFVSQVKSNPQNHYSLAEPRESYGQDSILYQENFASSQAHGWKEESDPSAVWQVKDEKYHLNIPTSNAKAVSIYQNGFSWQDYIFSFDAELNSGVDRNVIFRMQDEQNYYLLGLRGFWMFSPGDTPVIYLQRCYQGQCVGNNYGHFGLGAEYYNYLAAYRFDANKGALNNETSHIEIEAIGNRVKVFYNNNLLIDWLEETDNYSKSGTIGFSAWSGDYGSSDIAWDNLTVRTAP